MAQHRLSAFTARSGDDQGQGMAEAQAPSTQREDHHIPLEGSWVEVMRAKEAMTLGVQETMVGIEPQLRWY